MIARERIGRTPSRAILHKYSPDQPRDDHGRWSGGGEDNPSGAILAWSSIRGAQVIRAAIASGEPGAVGETLLRHVAESPPTTQRLYRGINMKRGQVTREFGPVYKPPPFDWDNPDAKAPAPKPRPVDLNLSGWTTNRTTAEGFARGDGVPVVLTLTPGAHALPTGSSSFFDDEQEWLTAGRFNVNLVGRESGYDGPKGYTVNLIQTGTFSTADEATGTKAAKRATTRRLVSGGARRDARLDPIIARVRAELIALLAEHTGVTKYVDTEPRDERGRWTSDGGGPKIELWPNDPGAREVVGQFHALAAMFPKAAAAVTSIGYGRTANADATTDYRTGRMEFNSDRLASPRDSRGWRVAGTEDPAGLMTHEFGHMVHATVRGTKAWTLALPEENALSGYSVAAADPWSRSQKPDWRERFAETFAAAYAPGSQEKDAPDAVALRAFLDSKRKIAKYSDAEPRDDHGRWTAGPSGPLDVIPPGMTGYGDDSMGGYNPNQVELPLSRDDKLFWIAASRDRLAAIRDHAGVPGTIGNAMLKEMAYGTPTTEPIYRGVRLLNDTSSRGYADDPPRAVSGFLTGDFVANTVVDLPLSSFSGSRDEALLYARADTPDRNGMYNDDGESIPTTNAFGGDPERTSVLLQIAPGAMTASIGSTFGGTTIDEQVTAGRFLVQNVSTREATVSSFDKTWLGPIRVVELKQVGLIDPDTGYNLPSGNAKPTAPDWFD